MPRDQDYGSPVTADRDLRYTSVSALQAFDPASYGGCNRRWYFKYVERRPEPQTGPQARGVEIHKQVEHYLLTGEDVLAPEARAGKHYLPRPGPDLLVERDFGRTADALALRDALFRRSGEDQAVLAREAVRLAGLAAGEIPMVGFIDLRHRRGEFVDEDGVLRTERAEHGRVTEVVDHKSTGNLRYAKEGSDLRDSLQMNGYACVADVASASDFVRLSHITYQTRGPKAARKTTAIVSVSEAREWWERRVAPLSRAMVDAARAARPEDVPANLGSCRAFNRDCSHSAYCHRPEYTIHDLLQVSKGASMSTGLWGSNGVGGQEPPAGEPAGLFSSQAAVPPPPLSPMAEADREAALADARRALEDEERSPPPLKVVPCGAEGCGVLAAPGWVRATGGGFTPCEACGGKGSPAPHVGEVNPPDAPAYDPIAAARPLPPEVVATITNPALRERVVAHAAASQAQAAAQAAAAPQAERAGGKCSRGGERVQLTREQAAKKCYPCTCGKELKIKPSSDFQEATLPGHLLKREAAPSPPSIPPPSAVAPPRQVEMGPPPIPPLPLPAASLQAETGARDFARQLRRIAEVIETRDDVWELFR